MLDRDCAIGGGPHHKLVVPRFKPEGMVSCEFDKGLSDPAGDKAPYFAIAYLKFNSLEDLQKALAKHGAVILGDIPKLHEDRTDHASERGAGELRPGGSLSRMPPGI
jgi:hypothetical protein